VTAAIDLRTRRVPNLATMSIAAAGFGMAVMNVSGLTLSRALAGCVLGLLLMLPGHVFGATGAGDVKLLAAMGTLLGPYGVLMAFLYTAIAGGILAFGVAARRKRLGGTINRVATLVRTGANAAEIEAEGQNNRFAYAPAIAVGTLVAALGLWI
jgi:prepilin peptidase CpaA